MALERVVRTKKEENRTRFVVKFDPRLPNIREILHGAWRVLTENQDMKDIFPAPPMVCYQRVKNVREMIVRAKLPAPVTRSSSRVRTNKDGFKPCRKSKCPVCDQLEDKGKIVKSVQSYATAEEVAIRGNLTCTSTNVIYCITCRKGRPSCPTHPQYIGETGKSLVERFRGHRGTVVQKGQDQTTAPVRWSPL